MEQRAGETGPERRISETTEQARRPERDPSPADHTGHQVPEELPGGTRGDGMPGGTLDR